MSELVEDCIGTPVPSISAHQVTAVLADADPFARAAIRNHLDRGRPSVSVSAVTGRRDQVLAHVQTHRPATLILDPFSWPEGGSLVAQATSLVPVLVFTHDASPTQLGACLDAGVAGFLCKDDGLDGLSEAAHAVVRGWAVTRHSLLRHSMRVARVARTTESLAALAGSLTVRESQVLRLLAEGLSNEAIARTLNTSAGTARCHVSRIMSKLQMNRSQLVLYAAGMASY